ncbi:hypothetical protein MMC31_004999 [Peltigera leucophlebia]|nr:hypothetical protein [Peltigera leucophlebia]
MDGKFFAGDAEIDEYIRNMTPGQSHALFLKTFTTILRATGLRSPEYYEDKSQCISFADIMPAEKATVKASHLKAGYIEPKDLIEWLRKLKPSRNFELREYDHPYMTWAKSPYGWKETPRDLAEQFPQWILHASIESSRILGHRRAEKYDNMMQERWYKIVRSVNRAPLPDLHLLRNAGSSPNGTLYPRYLVNGLFSLRERADEKALQIFSGNSKIAEDKREAAISNWEERHPDVKLNHHPFYIFRSWPPELMDELDEIDRDMIRNGRSTYIALLEEAEKPMQELVKFWRECGLITGQRTPPSPELPLLPEPSSPENHSPQLNRTSGENPSPSSPLNSSPTQDEIPQPQKTKLPGPAHKSKPDVGLLGPRNVWEGRLRSRTKEAKTGSQISRNRRNKSVRKPGTCQNLEISGKGAFDPTRRRGSRQLARQTG